MQFTTSAYVRTHGKAPKGQGSWGFQASRTTVAFELDLYGDIHFFFGTLTEAKSAARQAMDAKIVAVLG